MPIGADVIVGAAIGALGASQGVQLPGALLVGAGFDASAAIAYNINPGWFPQNRSPRLEDVLATLAGVAAGWVLTRAVLPHPNPAGGASPILAAGMAAGALLGGRSPGQLRLR